MPDKIKNTILKNEKWIYAAWLVGFLAWHIFVIMHHETWRDEAQAFALAKYLNMSQLIAQLPSEGHPILWFLISKAFIAVGLPYSAYSYLSLTFVMIALTVFLYGADFSMPEKLVVMGSAMFAFFNPVVSRSYCVLLLLVVLLGLAWQNYRKHFAWICLLTALLFQIHIFASGLAIALTICLITEAWKAKNKGMLVGSMLPVISLFMMVAELKQSADTKNEYVHVSIGHMVRSLASLEGFKSFYSNLYHGYNFFPLRVCKGLVLLVVPAFFIALIYLLIKQKIRITNIVKQVKEHFYFWLIVAFSFGAYLTIGLCINFFVHTQHCSVLFMYIVLGLWIAPEVYRQNAIYKLCRLTGMLMIGLSVGAVFYMAVFDVGHPFSASQKMATYIVEELDADSIVVVRTDPMSDAIAMHVEDLEEKLGAGPVLLGQRDYEPFHYYDWKRWVFDREFPEWKVSKSDFEQASTQSGATPGVYVVDIFEDEVPDEYQLIYVADGDEHRGENFYLFEVLR